MEWVERIYAGTPLSFGWEPPEPWHAEPLGAVILAYGGADWATYAWNERPRPKRAFEWLEPHQLAHYGSVAQEWVQRLATLPHATLYQTRLVEAIRRLQEEKGAISSRLLETALSAKAKALAAVIFETEASKFRVVQNFEGGTPHFYLERRWDDAAGEWGCVGGWWASGETEDEAERNFRARLADKVREYLDTAEREIRFAEQSRDHAAQVALQWRRARDTLLRVADGVHEETFADD